MKLKEKEVCSSFAAPCTALSATIGTGNIVGVATAVGTGGPGAIALDVDCSFCRNGNKICRRAFSNKV